MTEINATLVKTLRDRTGAGVTACKKALAETQGDLEAAVDRLRAAEISNAATKINRVAAEGLVSLVAEKRAALIKEAHKTGKPPDIVETMVEGRMRKSYEEVLLTTQPFALNADQRVEQALKEAEKTAGATIAVTAFVRFRTGEGIEKRAE